ncbi:MAG TPA: sulfotransferase [Syntrophales bacterium]|nr:sulfotransferase [Syntrophales bacterium]
MNKTERLFKQGEELFVKGRGEEARRCFLSVIEMEPRNKEALNNLGVIIYQEGNAQMATDYFLKALSLDPYYRDAVLNLAQILRATNQLTAMDPLLKKHIRYDPRDREIRAILDEMHLLTKRDSYDARPKDQETGEAFFILSAGNCGTLTLAEVLRTATNARVVYHPDDRLEENILPCYWGEAERRKIFRDARQILMHETWQDGLIYGETTPTVTLFADLLARDFPKSKFVVLTRDPSQYVRSYLFRNFYQGHPADSIRLGPSPDGRDYQEWKKAPQVEKICWLWNEFNSFIDRALETLDQGRFMVLRFEDLFGDIKTFNRLFDFLNLKGLSLSLISETLKTKRNANNYGRFPDICDWSPEFRRNVEQATMKYALKYGYFEAEPAGTGIKSKQPTVRHKKDPAVTVGLPLYSGGRMLTDSIESILSQDFENFELIIFDLGADPFVREIGAHYQKLDARVKFIHTGDRVNHIGAYNFSRLIELSSATYFMWGSYDDCLEKSFISSCLKVIDRDTGIALVYPRTKVLNREGEFLGIAEDFVKADMDDPFDRFLHVIWELQMCNAFHGLFRRHRMIKTNSLRKHCYAHDNLFLAEIALLGKIIQIDDVLFIRHLTRKLKSNLDEHYADVIRSMDPPYMEEGLTLPFCRFTYSHCELVNHSPLPPERKEFLTSEILRCFKHRWAIQLDYEINYLINLLKKGIYYRTWDGRTYGHNLMQQMPNLHYFHVTDVLKVMGEALFIFPEHQGLQEIFETCTSNIRSPNNGMVKPIQSYHGVSQ